MLVGGAWDVVEREVKRQHQHHTRGRHVDISWVGKDKRVRERMKKRPPGMVNKANNPSHLHLLALRLSTPRPCTHTPPTGLQIHLLALALTSTRCRRVQVRRYPHNAPQTADGERLPWSARSTPAGGRITSAGTGGSGSGGGGGVDVFDNHEARTDGDGALLGGEVDRVAGVGEWGEWG